MGRSFSFKRPFSAVAAARAFARSSTTPHGRATELENGAQLKDVQKAAGHRDPGTTKLYDRLGYHPEKAASFFAIY